MQTIEKPLEAQGIQVSKSPLKNRFARLLRVKQWAKNGVVLTALLFSGKFTDSKSIVMAGAATLAFCALSSATYILNDISDIDGDRLHPKKRFRPIPSGEISVKSALCIAVVCSVLAITTACFIGLNFGLTLLAYALVNLYYSTKGKHQALVDIFCIASGFVLRVVAGAIAISVAPSSWLLICTSLGALYLGIEKRRQELRMPQAALQRPVLAQYSNQALLRMESLITPSLVAFYGFYTFQNHGQWMMLTVPVVLFGIMRYQLLSESGANTEAPEEVLWTDKWIQLCIVIFAVISATVVSLHL
ncbi:MAG TPA: UbiA prenyltransferase family protein [Drouetiella sp.]